MYKNPQSYNRLKQAFFQSLAIENTKCLEPTETCSEPLIKSHSIQDSRILEALAFDNHVIHMTFDKSCIAKSTPTNPVIPTCRFEPISIHKASVFVGLCNRHDTEFFRPIDTEDLNMDNREHVFLLTYRSVLKELCSCKSAAVMNQSLFKAKVELGEISGDIPTLDGLLPVLFFERSYDFYQYKKHFDMDFIAKDYGNIAWKYLAFEGEPTFAVSSVFTPVEMALNGETPERLCINAFPYKGKTYVLFSCRVEDKVCMNSYVEEIFRSNEAYQKYLISKLVLRNCENFVISPKYFEKWSEQKKNAIAEYFKSTVESDRVGYENVELYLF